MSSEIMAELGFIILLRTIFCLMTASHVYRMKLDLKTGSLGHEKEVQVELKGGTLPTQKLQGSLVYYLESS